MNVMIGVDPHKGSHTATMLDRDEHELRRSGWCWFSVMSIHLAI